MPTPSETAVAGSPQAQKLITIIGITLGAVWLVTGVASIVSFRLNQATFDIYRLGKPGGLLWMQLIIYPFIAFSPSFLLLNLVWFRCLVRVARICLTPASFIRIYTLGTIGGGLIYLGASRLLLGESGQLTGSYLTLITMHGALAMLRPDATLFDHDIGGSGFEQKSSLPIFAFLFLIAIEGCGFGVFAILTRASNSDTFATFLPSILLWCGPLIIILTLMPQAPLVRSIVVLLVLDLASDLALLIFYGARLFNVLPFNLSALAALLLGVVYGRVEKALAQRQAAASNV